MSPAQPLRGEIWYVDLDPICGHEQAGRRSALVVSEDDFTLGPAGLVIIVPLTKRDRSIPLHVSVQPSETGLKVPSIIKTDNIRSVAKQRLSKRVGHVSAETMTDVEDRLRALLRL